MQEKIVVTGIGLATPLGLGREISWKKIKKGFSIISEPPPFLQGQSHQQSSTRPSSNFFGMGLSLMGRAQRVVSPEMRGGTENLSADLARFARATPFVNPNGLPRMFPIALVSVKEALTDSGIARNEVASERVGCSVSVSKPILSPNHSLPSVSPFFPLLPPESLSEYLVRELKISGPIRNVVAACATGVHSILIASRWLKENLCDVVIAGSVESSLHPLYISGFQKMGVLSDFPCPFDARRKGFILGEGAGILVLEREATARSRGAKIYAEISACSIGSDTFHPTTFVSDGSSIASVLSRAISDSGISGSDVDYINLHGTGTRSNDLTETRAIKRVFGKKADQISLSSTKAATGHLLGAAGSVEAALACLALRDGFVPPTANLENPAPECDLDYTARNGRQKKIETAISLSFGFGGAIGAVVFQKPDG